MASEEITARLQQAAEGDERAADALLGDLYAELKDLAARKLRAERAGHLLQPTALVHEAYLRLVDQTRIDWRGRTHFYASAAGTMRRVLIDHARSRDRKKRGGDWRGGQAA